MDNVILMVFTTFVFAIVLAIITFVVTRKKASKRYKNKANLLDIEKNKLINVKVFDNKET